MQEQEQSYKHHARYDPAFHFIGLPLVFINLIGSLIYLFSRPSWLAVLVAISAVGLLITFGSLRRYSTKLQDRVIRMEENFRHYTLTKVPLDANLTVSQITALRFASDQEFPALCTRAVSENLSIDEIKAAIQSWRADRLRV